MVDKDRNEGEVPGSEQSAFATLQPVRRKSEEVVNARPIVV